MQPFGERKQKRMTFDTKCTCNFRIIIFWSTFIFQKRLVQSGKEEKPKVKQESDITRERIIRRAALEFQDGMYGILQQPDNILYIHVNMMNKYSFTQS